MVRNIAGVLLKIGGGLKIHTGCGSISCENRRVAAETAPPDGLYLTQVFIEPSISFILKFLPCFN